MVTILILISRPTWLDRIFATLEMMDAKSDDTNIIGIVDGKYDLYVDARNKVEMSRFSSRLCVEFKSVEKLKNYDMMYRRNRISQIHNFAKQFIGKTEYIFSIEDDSIFGVGTLKKLQHDYAKYPYAGMISGAQVGRHGINHIGGWITDNIYDPYVIRSVELKQGIKPVDATGLYCSLIKAKNYMAHEFKPFEDCLGPDADFGFALRRQGLNNYIDFDISVSHMDKDKELTIKNTPIDSVTFVKNDNGRWRQKSEVTS